MRGIISDVNEQLAELGKDTGKKFVRDVVKGIPGAAKKQIMGTDQTKDKKVEDETGVDTGKDQITGKPSPSQKMLTHLSDAAAKLQMAKLQKVRQELQKQRLKTQVDRVEAGKKQVEAGTGPEVLVTPEEKKPKPEAVARTLRQSQATGEIKGPIAG